MVRGKLVPTASLTLAALTALAGGAGLASAAPASARTAAALRPHGTRPQTAGKLDGLIGTGAVAAVYAQGGIGTAVPLSTGSDEIDAVFAPNGLTAYVVNPSDNAVQPVAVVDDNALVQESPVGTGPDPVAAVVTPNGSRANVASFDQQAIKKYLQTVTAIKLSSGAVLRTITVGRGPISLGVQPGGTYVYSANFRAGTVSTIAVSTNAVITTTHFSGWHQPGYVAMRP